MVTYTALLHHFRKKSNTELVPKGFKSKTGKGGKKSSKCLREGEAQSSKPLREKKGINPNYWVRLKSGTIRWNQRAVYS